MGPLTVPHPPGPSNFPKRKFEGEREVRDWVWVRADGGGSSLCRQAAFPGGRGTDVWCLVTGGPRFHRGQRLMANGQRPPRARPLPPRQPHAALGDDVLLDFGGAAADGAADGEEVGGEDASVELGPG